LTRKEAAALPNVPPGVIAHLDAAIANPTLQKAGLHIVKGAKKRKRRQKVKP
jgi:hypothetical protein